MSAKVIYIPKKLWDLIKRAGIIILVCLIIGVIINLFSPSVTLTLETWDRLEFWVILCLIGGLGIFISDIILDVFAPAWTEIAKALVQSTAGAVTVLIPVFMIYGPEDLPSHETTVLFVWAIMALIVGGVFLLSRQAQTANLDVHSDDVLTTHHQAAPKVLSRLPVHLQEAELYALSAEDHYVRVHTSKGEEMVLMRLSDAIEETGGVIGAQTHRSWWVARSAIEKISSKGRTAEITLRSEVNVPVSRNALKTLKTMGWL